MAANSPAKIGTIRAALAGLINKREDDGVSSGGTGDPHEGRVTSSTRQRLADVPSAPSICRPISAMAR